ncbi:MAG TPA: hypothetical protein VNG13_06380 [Mycobacteriales bacterium]|nr:hypothetical protein [Mycobacteriales bacterium]
MAVRRRSAPSSLEEHPNLAEILGVLAQLPHVTDAELPALAAGWHNTVYLADARSRALDADSPLVLEVLAAFEAVQALFADDLAGEEHYISVDPQVTTVALKAVRDAIAGAYARPILSRGEYLALMRAWRSVYPVSAVDEPDLGPNAAQVKSVLATLPLLATRCHDAAAAELFSTLKERAGRFDDRVREAARDETWQAACLTSRRRLWMLVRRSGAQGIGRICLTCPPAGRVRQDPDAEQQVLALCLDAACALLVADTVDDNLTDALVLPLRELIPSPRSSS